jgi:serine/threonine protein kinase
MYFGMDQDAYVLAMELLGPTLTRLFERCRFRFGLKAVLMIADQVLTRLEYLHRKGLVHRDVKPDNMSIGCGNRRNIVYLLDFGLARSINSGNSGENATFVGSAQFASISAHKGMGGTPQSDLESLGYTLIFLLTGSLPWISTQGPDPASRVKIMRWKEQTPPDVLCATVPGAFLDYMTIVMGLGDELPDYAHLRGIFRTLFIESGFVFDWKYNWVRAIESPPSFRFAGSGPAEEWPPKAVKPPQSLVRDGDVREPRKFMPIRRMKSVTGLRPSSGWGTEKLAMAMSKKGLGSMLFGKGVTGKRSLDEEPTLVAREVEKSVAEAVNEL